MLGTLKMTSVVLKLFGKCFSLGLLQLDDLVKMTAASFLESGNFSTKLYIF